jgi:hypothetical protein
MTTRETGGLDAWQYYAGWNAVCLLFTTQLIRIFEDGLQVPETQTGYLILIVTTIAASTIYNVYRSDGSTLTKLTHWILAHAWVLIPAGFLAIAVNGVVVAENAVLTGRIAGGIALGYEAMRRIDWVRQLFE